MVSSFSLLTQNYMLPKIGSKSVINNKVSCPLDNMFVYFKETVECFLVMNTHNKNQYFPQVKTIIAWQLKKQIHKFKIEFDKF